MLVGPTQVAVCYTFETKNLLKSGHLGVHFMCNSELSWASKISKSAARLTYLSYSVVGCPEGFPFLTSIILNIGISDLNNFVVCY
jgi:hypothetical protein